MAKALLQEEVRKAIARKNSQETPAASLPVPIPVLKPPAASTYSSSPVLLPVYTPSPPQIQQVIIYPPRDDTALLKEKAEKEKAQELYEAEKAARLKSHEWHKEELERVKQATKEQLEAEHQARIKAEELQQQELERSKQLVKEDTSLKRRHSITLEKTKTDEETIQRITQEKERLAQENETLKQEIERLKKASEKAELPSHASVKEEEHKGEKPVPVPPPYDEADKPEPLDLTAHNNDMSLTGEIAPDTPVDDGSNDKCVVS